LIKVLDILRGVLHDSLVVQASLIAKTD